MALSKIQTVENQVIPNIGGRNFIINGAHNIAQRLLTGTGYAATGTTTPITVSLPAAYRTVDRWKTDIDGTSGHDWSISQSTDAPDGFSHSSKVAVVTSGAQPATGAQHQFFTMLEKRDVERLKWGTSEAKTVTFSFYVKSSVTGNHGIRFFHYDATSTNTTYNTHYTINTANTWERKSITVTGPTTGGIEPNDWEKTFIVEFNLGAAADLEGVSGYQSWATGTIMQSGTVYLPATAGATWFVTGCQLEEGTTTTPFEHIHPRDELSRCQRYFYRPSRVGGAGENTNFGYGINQSSQYGAGSIVYIDYPVIMRINPNLTYSQAGGTVSNDNSGQHRAQLYDSDDGGFYVYDLKADAEL